MTKLSPQGNGDQDLIYSTLLGGGSGDRGSDIVVDASGNAYVTGRTDNPVGNQFPTRPEPGAYDTSHNGSEDVFVAKINPAGNGASDLVYSTFLGGSADDEGHGIAIDESGNAYVTGQTGSSAFPFTPDAFDTSHNGSDDVFITKLSPQGNGEDDLIYSTFLGGSGADIAQGIDLDSSGNAYVTGQTGGGAPNPFPTTMHAFDNVISGNTKKAFVTRLDSQGSELIYSTFLGGPGLSIGNAITVDSLLNIYVTGDTDSDNFPATVGAYDPDYNSDDTSNGPTDAFVAKFSPVRCGGKAVTTGCTVNGVDNQLCLGLAGDDEIIGTSRKDVIHGLGGDDIINGGGKKDIICGGDGDDELNGGAGNDKLLGGAKNDTMDGGPGTKDVCNGGPGGNDTATNCETEIKIP